MNNPAQKDKPTDPTYPGGEDETPGRKKTPPVTEPTENEPAKRALTGC
jgi:hypothetical protein